MTSSVIEVMFKVKARLRFGEEVRLSGNLPALGCDDIDRAIPLVTSPTTFPMWSTREAIFVPENYHSVEYRYLVFSGGKFLRYEKYSEEKRNLRFRNIESTQEAIDRLDEGTPIGNISEHGRDAISANSYAARNRARQFADSGRRSIDQIKSSDSVVVVSYYLPVFLRKNKEDKWVAQWNNENILSFETKLTVKWVGTVHSSNPINPEDEDEISEVLLRMNCFPIFINRDMHRKFYNIVCKQHLWPVMHHNADVYGPAGLKDLGHQSEKELWIVYSTVNSIFGHKVVEVYQDGAMIWIHGFHLMLLPFNVRRSIQAAKIGMFLHTPFPSSEIWKTLWCRTDLLRGMLSADQIGFHLYEYGRHFLTTCRRVLGTHYEFDAAGALTVHVGGRKVYITCVHVGVDHRHISRAIERQDFETEVTAWQNKFAGKTVIASIDRLERLKCVPLKLKTIELFVNENPSYIDKVVFVIIGISASERGEDFLQSRRDVRCLVTRLNRKHPGLIHFEERKEHEMRLFQRLSLFCISEVLLVTAIRDGLNRLPIEYTLARSIARRREDVTVSDTTQVTFTDIRSRSGDGVVVLSEFVSTARVMRGALLINPWKVHEVKESILRALEMAPEERNSRFKRNLEFANRLNTVTWAETILQDLKKVEKNAAELSHSSTLGLGIDFRMTGVSAGFRALDLVQVSKDFRAAHHRLILLDWGGTLVESLDTYEAYAVASGHMPRGGMSDELVDILQPLGSDVRNHIFIISGKDIYSMQEFFGSVDGIGLAAEHGCYYRFPKRTHGPLAAGSDKQKWNMMISLDDTSWMDAVRRVMDVYTQRTHGTYIEQKGSAIIWQFRDADRDFGIMQSKELEEHLSEVVSTHQTPLEIIRGGGIDDGYIEVRPEGVSKGLFMEHIMSMLKSQGIVVDFVMGIGDDITDEDMFKAIRRLDAKSHAKGATSRQLTCYAVAVGKKHSAAQAYVDDPDAVVELLRIFKKNTMSERKFHSALDLSHHGKDMPKVSRRVSDLAINMTRSTSDSHFTKSKGLSESGGDLSAIPGRSPTHSFATGDSESDEDDGIFF